MGNQVEKFRQYLKEFSELFRVEDEFSDWKIYNGDTAFLRLSYREEIRQGILGNEAAKPFVMIMEHGGNFEDLIQAMVNSLGSQKGIEFDLSRYNLSEDDIKPLYAKFGSYYEGIGPRIPVAAVDIEHKKVYITEQAREEIIAEEAIHTVLYDLESRVSFGNIPHTKIVELFGAYARHYAQVKHNVQVIPIHEFTSLAHVEAEVLYRMIVDSCGEDFERTTQAMLELSKGNLEILNSLSGQKPKKEYIELLQKYKQ